MTATPTDPPAEPRVGRDAPTDVERTDVAPTDVEPTDVAPTDVEPGPPAGGQRDGEPAVVLTTDAEAQTDDPLIDPDNS